MQSLFVFYGNCSGPKPSSDPKLYRKVAHTLSVTLQRLHPESTVSIHRALSKDELLAPLLDASTPIQQVHIVCDCDSEGLYLEGLSNRRDALTSHAANWIRRGRRFDLSLSRADETLESLRQDKALLSGYLSSAMDFIDLEQLKQKHSDDALWHIWGGNAGQLETQFGDPTNAIRNDYLKQFNNGSGTVPGIAADIAQALEISCSAVRGSGAWSAFGATRTRKLAPLRPHDRLPVPIWLWPAGSDSWITISPSSEIVTPSVLGQHLGLNETPAHSVAPLFWSKPTRPGQGSGPAPALKTGQGGPKKKPVKPTPLTISFQPNDSNTRAFYPKRNDPNTWLAKSP